MSSTESDLDKLSKENWAIFLACSMKPEEVMKTGWKIDLDAHIRMAAAAYLYQIGEISRILITGGKMNGSNNPPLSDILTWEFEHKYKIKGDHLDQEIYSHDTTENAENSLFILEQLGVKKATFITNKYHYARTKVCFDKFGDKYGIEVTGTPAEAIVETISHRHRDLIKEYLNSEHVKKSEKFNRNIIKLLKIPLVGVKLCRTLAYQSMLRQNSKK